MFWFGLVLWGWFGLVWGDWIGLIWGDWIGLVWFGLVWRTKWVIWDDNF